MFVAIATLASLGIFLGTQRAQAQSQEQTRPDRISFGLVGITPGQTARINVVNAAPTDDPYWPPGPSRVVLTFLDSEGRYFRGRDGNPVGRVVMLEPGRSASLNLNADEFAAGAARFQLRALVMVWPPGPTAPPNPTVPTLEVIDNSTGKTLLLYPGVIRGFNPQPDPPVAGQ